MSTAAQPTEPAADRPPEPARTRAPALPAKTLPGEGGLRRLPGVVLFARGSHTDMAGRTKHYDDDYLETVARNFSELLTDPDFHHEPPACLGHEAVQAKLAEILAGDDTYQRHLAGHKPTSGGGPGRTDEPAAGWWKNLKYDRPSGRLTADLENIPPSVADRIDSGEYRYPSVELKETAVRPDGRPVGPFLWRCPILGATPPGCKTIPALGESHFADRPEGVVCFADPTGALPGDAPPEADGPPDKPMLALLQKCYPQLSTAFLQSLTRKQMDQLATDHVAAHPDQQQPTPPNEYGVTAMADTITDAAKPKPKPPAEPPPNPAAPKPAPAPKPTPSAELAEFADAIEARVTAKFAEREAALDAKAEAIRRAAESAQKSIDAREFAEWSETVDRAVDAAVRANKIAPSLADPANPRNIRARLKAIPADETFAFADAQGNEVREPRRKTELAALNDTPERMFGDRVSVGKPGRGDPDAVTPERKKELLAHYGPLGRVALADMQKAVARN